MRLGSSTRGRHQLANGIEDDLGLRVVATLQRIQLVSKFRMRMQQLSQSDDARMITMFTCTARGLRSTLEKHGDALFGEREGAVPAATPGT